MGKIEKALRYLASGQAVEGPPYSLLMEGVVLSDFAGSSRYRGAKACLRGPLAPDNLDMGWLRDQFSADLGRGMLPILTLRNELLADAGPAAWQKFVRAYFYRHCHETIELIEEGVSDG